jgi:hypothetical protein
MSSNWDQENQNNKKLRTSYNPVKNELLYFYIFYFFSIGFSAVLLEYINNSTSYNFYSAVIFLLVNNFVSIYIQQKEKFFYHDLISYVMTVKKYQSKIIPIFIIFFIVFIYILYKIYEIINTEIFIHILYLIGLSFILEIGNKIIISSYLKRN